jgi:hypothetical protein
MIRAGCKILPDQKIVVVGYGKAQGIGLWVIVWRTPSTYIFNPEELELPSAAFTNHVSR